LAIGFRLHSQFDITLEFEFPVNGSLFMNIRKVALITFIAAILGLLMPLWNISQTAVSAVSTHPPWKWWMIPALVFAVLISVIMPVFYFALFRNEGPLQFPKHLRPLSLAAALLFAITMASGFLPWAGPFGPGENTSVLTEVSGALNVRHIAALLGVLSNLAYLLLLVTFFQHSNAESNEASSRSAFLTFIAKVAVMVWAVWLVFNVARLLIFTPYSYFEIRDYLGRMGRTPPLLRDMMAQSLLNLVEQGCLFTAPFVVYRSRSGR
jgi:hypothetical protein